jgi:predicted RNase H-like nuclease
MRVLGVDACPGGWVGVLLGDLRPRAYVERGVDALVRTAEAAAGPVGVVAVDIPIGLPDTGRREADVLARQAAGPRGSSVFLTPVREALTAADHATAVRVNRDLAGQGVSVQAFGLRKRILEVEGWVPAAGRPVVEVHPEVCFAALAGSPLSTRKSTWAGAEERRRLLRGAGIALDEHLGPAGERAGVDDVLDAAAAAWTARRYAAGTAYCLPQRPEVFSDGLGSAIWV